MLINFSYFWFGFLLDLRRKEHNCCRNSRTSKVFSCLDTCVVMYTTNSFYEDWIKIFHFYFSNLGLFTLLPLLTFLCRLQIRLLSFPDKSLGLFACWSTIKLHSICLSFIFEQRRELLCCLLISSLFKNKQLPTKTATASRIFFMNWFFKWQKSWSSWP